MTHVNKHDAREQYLDYLARCRQAYTPFAPIELPDFFAGRKDVIEDIRGELQAPGRQVAIYGERGVGKTSLAQLLSFFAKYDDENVHTFRCGKETTFDDIYRALVVHAGHPYVISEMQMESTRGVKGGIGPVGAERKSRKSSKYRSLADTCFTPAGLLDIFSGSEALLIIDEYDRVRDDERTNVRMAELIKYFSDARSSTKIVIVGVAETLSQLIGEHESLSRSLAQIRLPRMNKTELSAIIERGASRIGAAVDPLIARRAVALADGFPHFVHLMCLYASIAAGDTLLDDPPATPLIGEEAYRLGLGSAIDKVEHSLQEAYDVAVITTRRKSDIYELTLRAMAMSDERDVQVRELARHASSLTGETLLPQKFSNALGQLIKTDKGGILAKVRDGYYKFTNPLMRAYVRCKLELENITQHDGQHEFPFMRT